jgi:phosphonate transport system substrate-binding protein
MMTLLSKPSRVTRCGHWTIAMMVLVLAAGCSSDAGYQPVDFSVKMQVEHPDQQVLPNKTLRVAIAAMISPRETFSYYHALIDYIGSQMGYQVQLVQRKTYGEINALFPKRRIDLAFVCTGPYANGKAQYGFVGLATPIVRGEPYYHSYLIVHKQSAFQSLADLRDQVFAYTDPESNTGALVPNYWLSQMNESPAFFKNVTYTYSHDNSILAVAKGLVAGAAIDGHIWEFYQQRSPVYTSRTRIIKKSEPFGSPPLVASTFLDESIRSKIADVVLSMHQQPEGKKILKELMIDRFVPVEERWYQPVRRLYSTMAVIGKNDAPGKP